MLAVSTTAHHLICLHAFSVSAAHKTKRHAATNHLWALRLIRLNKDAAWAEKGNIGKYAI
jgi:hypothetical protein